MDPFLRRKVSNLSLLFEERPVFILVLEKRLYVHSWVSEIYDFFSFNSSYLNLLQLNSWNQTKKLHLSFGKKIGATIFHWNWEDHELCVDSVSMCGDKEVSCPIYKYQPKCFLVLLSRTSVLLKRISVLFKETHFFSIALQYFLSTP